MLIEALAYAEKHGFSVIPVRPDKKPHIQWLEFQMRKATPDEIISWWAKWPNAMVGIVTGKLSGILAIDCDSGNGYMQIQEHLRDSLVIPTANTPRGGKHLYFAYPADEGMPISVGTGLIPTVDFRGEGGYIIAPPSRNGNGHAYAWLDGLSLDDVGPPAVPDALYNKLINKYIYKASVNAVPGGAGAVEMFVEGRRDNDLFRTANSLVKGGMAISEIEQVIDMLALSCRPPFPANEIEKKIKSALDRAVRRERNLTEEVREWVMSSSGVFSSSAVGRSLQLSTRDDQKNLSKIMRRLLQEGLLERYGNKNGHFRRIEGEIELMNYLDAPTDEFPLQWPLDIEDLCKIYPGNVVVVAGSKSAGKTAFLLNLVKMNMEQHDIVYLNSEMGATELRIRLQLFEDPPLPSWRFTPIERRGNWADLITAERKIWIVDFLDVTEDLWRVGSEIKAIHNKLRDGICIIGLQKRKDRDTGHGDGFSMEKARLYLALDFGRIKIVDAKAWRRSEENPRGKVREFKIVKGSRFVPQGYWKAE